MIVHSVERSTQQWRAFLATMRSWVSCKQLSFNADTRTKDAMRYTLSISLMNITANVVIVLSATKKLSRKTCKPTLLHHAWTITYNVSFVLRQAIVSGFLKITNALLCMMERKKMQKSTFLLKIELLTYQLFKIILSHSNALHALISWDNQLSVLLVLDNSVIDVILIIEPQITSAQIVNNIIL